MKIKKHIGSIIIVTLLIITSLGTYLCYPLIQKAVAKQNQSSEYVADFMNNDLSSYLYAINFIAQKKQNHLNDFSQYYQVLEESTQDPTAIENIKIDIEDDIAASLDELQQDKDIFYQWVDHQSQKSFSNTKDDLSSIDKNTQLQDRYQWYLQIQFDQDGHPNISFASHFDFLDKNTLPSYQETFYDSYEQPITIEYQPLTQQTITLAVSSQLHGDSHIGAYTFHYSTSDYFRFSLPYIATAIFAVMLVIFFTPIRYLNDNKFLTSIIRIKFAFLLIIMSTLMTFMFLGYGFLIEATQQNLMVYFYQSFGIEDYAQYLDPLINIGYFFVFYLLFVILAYFLKYFCHKGFKAYFKENTCLGWLFNNSQKLINRVLSFDLNDDINKVVLKIVLLNLAIIAFCSLFFVFGIFFALIYSVIIFILIKNKFMDIQHDYHVLLHATKKLSNGNFDNTIDQDVGIFNPLKDEFSHIKDGFEKAVNEEVKSQKMKTELISNVSHDLKTPLTSIITYVDLLKNKQLDEQDQKHYLDILERNSLRLKNLIEDLFEVSKANSGDVKLDFVDIDIISLIKQAQLECQDKLDEKSLTIKWNIENEKIICRLDSSKTYRIFENLFINMSKYALSHTRVYIDIKEQDNTVQIIFKNISEAEMTFQENEIVERFVQGDKSRNSGGSGLGLAIIKSFTELQGGQFRVEIDGDLFKAILTLKTKTTISKANENSL